RSRLRSGAAEIFCAMVGNNSDGNRTVPCQAVSLRLARVCRRPPTVKYLLAGRKSSVFELTFQKIVIAIAVLVLAVSINLSVAATTLPTTSNNGRSTLNGSAPTWANNNNYKSPADPASYVGFRVYLGWSNP